jgi:mono/diheme cytochrome c family protein
MRFNKNHRVVFVVGGAFAMAATLMMAGCTSNGGAKHEQGGQHDPGWVVPESAAKQKNPIPANSESAARGEEVFKTNCVVCHGSEGKGNGPAAAGLTPRPADLASPEVQKQSDGALHWRIDVGHKGMPAFKKQLTNKQIWDVINYVRTLASKS